MTSRSRQKATPEPSQYPLDAAAPLSISVVSAVASEQGVSAVDLSPPLYDAINPDALDALFNGRPNSFSISFDYNGYDIEVTSQHVTLTQL